MTSPMPGFMFDIETEEVSFVKRPANKRRFLLTKNNGANITMDELFRIVMETEAANEDALVEALKSRGISDKGVEAVKGILRLASAYADELDPDTFKTIGKSLGYAFDTSESKEKPVIEKTELKDLPAETRGKIEALLKSHEEDREAIETLTKRLDEAEDEKVLTSYVEKCREFTHLNAKAEDLGRMVKVLADADEAQGKTLLETLRAANTVAGNAALLGERGSHLTPTGDAIDEVESAAKAVALEKGISIGKARDEVLRNNKDLAERYLREVRGS